MDRMNPLDASFLYIENGTTHMHIASCAVFDGPAPEYKTIVGLLAAKLPLVPRYRQRVRFVPLDLARPLEQLRHRLRHRRPRHRRARAHRRRNPRPREFHAARSPSGPASALRRPLARPDARAGMSAQTMT